MRGKFLYPSDDYFKPFYGVAINYYKETPVEAADRLGVEVDDLTDEMYGHNGLLATFGPTEHNDAPGVALYKWIDSTLTKLTSVSLSIPADTWHWLQVEFIEGEIRVKYRLDTSNTWNEIITYLYDQEELPWKSDVYGHGAIVLKNVMPSFSYYAFGVDDETIGVSSDISALPDEGTILVDEEQINYYKGYTGAVSPELEIKFWPAIKWSSSFGAAGVPVAVTYFDQYVDHAFADAAAVVRGYGEGRTFRVSDYDHTGLQVWEPSSYVPGWSTYIGMSGFGSWVPSPHSAVYLHPIDVYSVLWHGGEMDTGPYSSLLLTQALHIFMPRGAE